MDNIITKLVQWENNLNDSLKQFPKDNDPYNILDRVSSNKSFIYKKLNTLKE